MIRFLTYMRPLHRTPTPQIYRASFGIELPTQLSKHDVWPGYPAGFIRRHENTEVGDVAVPLKETLTGPFF